MAFFGYEFRYNKNDQIFWYSHNKIWFSDTTQMYEYILGHGSCCGTKITTTDVVGRDQPCVLYICNVRIKLVQGLLSKIQKQSYNELGILPNLWVHWYSFFLPYQHSLSRNCVWSDALVTQTICSFNYTGQHRLKIFYWEGLAISISLMKK